MQTPEPRIAILMATYRPDSGFLSEQLQSFCTQTRTDWALLLSDDSPTETQTQVWADFGRRERHRIAAELRGPGRGFAANFLFLLTRVPDWADFVALSDQDDVWLPDHLERAVAALTTGTGSDGGAEPGQPALYCGRTRTSARDLTPLGLSPPRRRQASFGNALVESIAGGNTMVMNRAAIAILRAAAAEAATVVAHDWWIYQLITATGGRVIHDDHPTVLYRQHGGNAIGAPSGMRARLRRLRGLVSQRYRGWQDISVAALKRSAHRFTPEAQARLQAFHRARSGALSGRLRALRASGVYRQSAAGTVLLWLACLGGRL